MGLAVWVFWREALWRELNLVFPISYLCFFLGSRIDFSLMMPEAGRVISLSAVIELGIWLAQSTRVPWSFGFRMVVQGSPVIIGGAGIRIRVFAWAACPKEGSDHRTEIVRANDCNGRTIGWSMMGMSPSISSVLYAAAPTVLFFFSFFPFLL